MSTRWLPVATALIFGACSLTSSLDDLKGGVDAGPDAASGGSDSSIGGSGGAAGSGASGGTGGTGGTSSDGGGTGGSGGGTGATGGSGGGDADAADPCASDPNCSSCCQTSHSQGAKDFVAAIQACVCTGSSSCASVCAAFCNNGQIDQSCGTCVATQAVQDCLVSKCTSVDCQSYLACAGSC